jgi:hypothetical protein
MTDTLIDYDPNDSGEVARLPGEHRTRIDLGEATQNLNPYLVPSGPFPIPLRYSDAVPDSLVTGHGYDPEAHPGPVVDMVDTVTFPPPPLYDAQPIAPWERVADTAQLSLLGSVAGIDGELNPPPPGPDPLPPPPPPKPRYVGRHRLTWGGRVRRLLARMGVVGVALAAIWAGLVLAAVGVFW